MPPTAPNSKDNPALGEAPTPFQGPPEDEDLWERYNKRLEFPVATVAAVFLHVIVGALLVYILVGLMDGGEDRSNPPMQIVAVGGMDDTGDGSAGGGGESVDLTVSTDQFAGGPDNPLKLNNISDPTASDPTPALPALPGKLPLPNPNPGAPGGGKASRKGDGTGGTGPGGAGADSTAARGHRWVLRFRVQDAKDYLAQLRAMGAEISVPLPPDEKQHILIRDLKDPQQKAITGDLKDLRPKEGDDAEVKRLKTLVGFWDGRPNQVREITAALKIPSSSQPSMFRAHFPKSLEDELGRKEKAYRNRRPEDIKNTYFRVVVREGVSTLEVDEQTVYK